MTSMEAELRDMKVFVKEDVNEIKENTRTLSAQMSTMAEAHGELRGIITMALSHSKN